MGCKANFLRILRWRNIGWSFFFMDFILLDAPLIFFDDLRVDLIPLAERKLLARKGGARIAGDEVLGVVDMLAANGGLDHECAVNNFINYVQVEIRRGVRCL
jgi:hypothetical protein